jgi:hypothetical protein
MDCFALVVIKELVSLGLIQRLEVLMVSKYTHCIHCGKKLNPNRENKNTKLHQECKVAYMKQNKLGFFRGF